MPKVQVFRPTGLPQYLEVVEKHQRAAKHSLWFRGTGVQSYPLIPSIYRHPTKSSRTDLQELERQLMVRFRQRSIPYHSRDLSNDWEALFFMQHYAVPTRLLDWTENPLIALHFAMMSAPRKVRKNGQIEYSKPAAVWVLDPVAWNRAALTHISFIGGPLTPGDDALNGYSPSATATPMNEHPVAIYGAHNSARIVSQQGVFTIFGTNKVSMEKLIQRGTFPAHALSCIIIPPARIGQMRRSLLNQGITETVVFPDLEGLARETKRHFGFEA